MRCRKPPSAIKKLQESGQNRGQKYKNLVERKPGHGLEKRFDKIIYKEGTPNQL